MNPITEAVSHCWARPRLGDFGERDRAVGLDETAQAERSPTHQLPHEL